MNRKCTFRRSVGLCIVASLAGWPAAPARADLSSTFDFVVLENKDDQDVSGMLYTLEVTDTDADGFSLDGTGADGVNRVRFRLSNLSTDSSVATAIYFDDGVLLGISDIINPDKSTGMQVRFQEDMDMAAGGVSPSDLPGGAQIGFQTLVMDGALLAPRSDDPETENGLSSGEHVDIFFDLINNGTVSQAIAQMNDLTIRAGIHIQAVGTDDDDDGHPDHEISALAVPGPPVPAPGAALLGAVGLGTVGWARRRFQ